MLTSGGEFRQNAAICMILISENYNYCRVFGIYGGYRGLINLIIWFALRKDKKEGVFKTPSSCFYL